MRTRPITALTVVLLSGLLLATHTSSARGGLHALHQRESPILPDLTLTPGDALPVSTADVCRAGYSSLAGDIPASVREQIYKEYGIEHHSRGEYEIDRLIPIELGGTNALRNLWPQSYRTRPWNARLKNKLEAALHGDICSGKIDIKVAQTRIARNWIVLYKERFPVDSYSRTPSSTTGPMPRNKQSK